MAAPVPDSGAILLPPQSDTDDQYGYPSAHEHGTRERNDDQSRPDPRVEFEADEDEDTGDEDHEEDEEVQVINELWQDHQTEQISFSFNRIIQRDEVLRRIIE